jgi:hypothetical protein
MYGQFAGDRDNRKIKIIAYGNKKHRRAIRTFYHDYIKHQMIQDVLEYSGFTNFSDFIIEKGRLKNHSFDIFAKKYGTTRSNLCIIFKRARAIETIKLLKFGIITIDEI